MKEELVKVIEIPQGVTVELKDNILLVKGLQGENKRELDYPTLSIAVDGGKVIIKAPKATRREKRMAGTYVAHIKNLINGVQEKFNYTLKICSGHFPMNVVVSGNSLQVKNYLGEKYPRKIEFPQSVNVKVNGDKIEIQSCNKEDAGMVAAKIEKLCHPGNKDRRIFQDGIYIISKA